MHSAIMICKLWDTLFVTILRLTIQEDGMYGNAKSFVHLEGYITVYMPYTGVWKIRDVLL